jgi:hypothetical protein
MTQKSSTVRNLRTVKAVRGQSLTIDLGKTYEGYTIEAWMKKDPNSVTYRSFEIIDKRYLFLSQEKAQDYYNESTYVLEESIEGRWFFDVRVLIDGSTDEDDEHIVNKGIIHFEDNITDTLGQELVSSSKPYATQFLQLNDTPIDFIGSAGKTLQVNSSETAIEFKNIIEDLTYIHDQGIPSLEWEVSHDLDKYPSAVAVDSAGSVVVGQVEYIDLNNIKITFNASFSGTAYIN